MSLVDFGCVSKRGTLLGVNQFSLNEFQIEIPIFGLNYPTFVSIPLSFSFQNRKDVICKETFTPRRLVFSLT